MFLTHRASRLVLPGALTAILALSGCQMPAPPEVVPPAAKPADDIDLKGAASYVASDLARQLGPGSQARKIAIDPLLDRTSGQQTGVSVRVQEEILAALGVAIKDLMVVPFNADSGATGTFSNS